MDATEPAATTGEVTLRDVTEADLPIFYEHQQDPEANRMAAFPARDRGAFMAHWARILGDDHIDKQTILVNGRVAGNIVSFKHFGKREVGYWIGREYWGKGIATRALRAFLGQVRTRPQYAHVAGHNIASRRVLEKCGFTIIRDNVGKAQTGSDQVEEELLRLDGASNDAWKTRYLPPKFCLASIELLPIRHDLRGVVSSTYNVVERHRIRRDETGHCSAGPILCPIGSPKSLGMDAWRLGNLLR